MDVIEIERTFTAWLAEKLNLAVDNGIYRGGIPQGVDYGVAVIFGSEVKATGAQPAHPPRLSRRRASRGTWAAARRRRG